MRSERERDALDGIKLNLEAIDAFIQGLDFRTFETDLKTCYAVVRALEVISEASRRLSDELKTRHPDVPWRAIRDAGNVYRDAYSRIAARLVWETASEQLGPLRRAVIRELGSIDPLPPGAERDP